MMPAHLSPARLHRLHQSMMRRLRTQSFMLLATLSVAVAVGAALLHVSIRMQVIRIGYQLSHETKLHHELDQQNQRLRLELATRKDPAQIERLARERLRMTSPDPGAIRVLPGELYAAPTSVAQRRPAP